METKMEAPSAVQANKGFKVWWQLMRPHTLTAGFVPVTIGTALALHEGQINILLFLSMLIASLLIQAATNMFNEYYDYKRGLDNEESVGIGGAIVRDGVKPETVLGLALSFFGIATLIGVYICMESSWWLAVIGLICMLVAYLYTGGPLPIAYTPFGEVISGLFMGLIIILLSFYIQAGTVTTESILISIPISILVGAIMLSNNIRDLDGDKENGRKTVAILLGRKKAVTLLATMFTVSYLWVVGLAFTSEFSFWLLLVFLSIPKAYQAVIGFKGKTKPIEMMPAMKATAQTNTIFGFLLTIGLTVSFFV
ncbi:MAG TPA: 1,4-dihydroxy-2-naphthoate polyprenyltransferase [Bacillus sp. (in: firmicutes)]|uniref:1,4-dihydroxy-2-naphthoate polyprenyltransferase n=1 Tax=Bacillus litorisediminis TaxID=2922713 RepID=UPI001FAD88CC|nr:1,4-dihydroxy-2-naphthoate polyprenyltransferase [Bacillus litorisediminis]HWO75678.1 1,4-dihydroxy-2-naphthoate polyprenyltransferase [Bacillus sp. (in: firmicutes)]